MDFNLPEELIELKKSVREFVGNELLPIQQQVEKEDKIPDEVLKKMASLGYFGFPFPEKYGGVEIGYLGYCLALEELGRANAAYSNIIGAHTSIGSSSIYYGGNEAQKQKYLIPLAEGKKLAAFGLTEPGAGSDAAGIRTTAYKKGDHYYINGQKIWITNGPYADVVVVYASTDKTLGPKGVSAFIVEKNFPGFVVGKTDEKMGLKGSHTCTLYFEDCEVPEENRIGPEGTGFYTAMKTLDGGRITLAAGAVGAAQALLDLSVKHATERVQFGKPIGANQAIQWMLADMEVEIHAARLMTYHAAWKLDNGQRVSHEAAMVKVYASEMANRVADKALQIHGGLGYMQEYSIERAYRDARILRIYEGTSEVQRMIIAEDLLKAVRKD
ncbi:MAG: acyl-CoA dehydrogenase family protein [Chloroflexi bacterium]|uniref:Acyl-CoA dehydrogenase family protein n=1 Tax=Candidatus Chlorohelix allophototropha TaxID=3003348 RepID=A0A8T7LZR2_9CHLR|nr:acyl-CoA dehydrogenase family protein [Chloroflexota bacterium]WJW66959.1 acyl-CoA dehydrogenase family protein [Chloroflexota bacterium L227-S17]